MDAGLALKVHDGGLIYEFADVDISSKEAKEVFKTHWVPSVGWNCYPIDRICSDKSDAKTGAIFVPAGYTLVELRPSEVGKSVSLHTITAGGGYLNVFTRVSLVDGANRAAAAKVSRAYQKVQELKNVVVDEDEDEDDVMDEDEDDNARQLAAMALMNKVKVAEQRAAAMGVAMGALRTPLAMESVVAPLEQGSVGLALRAAEEGRATMLQAVMDMLTPPPAKTPAKTPAKSPGKKAAY
jgi:hypothetical protein